jgi:transmembrane sensor
MTTFRCKAMPSSSKELHNTVSQQAVHWLVRLRSDDLSEAETLAFADWLSRDISHSQAFAAAEDTLNDMAFVAKYSGTLAAAGETGSPKISTGTQTFSKKHPVQRPTPRRWIALSMGLAASWLFAVLLIMPEQSQLIRDFFSDYHTDTGELRDIKLADGSRLLLNTNTAVSIDYTSGLRQIALHHGQARFTVAADRQRPFEVVAEGLTVTALGTVFEIYSETSGDVHVIVEEHAVSARTQGSTPFPASTDLREGQQLFYRPGQNLQVTAVDTDLSSAWQRHELVINDRPLIELINELERYRAGRIFIADDKLKSMRVTGVFPLDNPEVVIESIRKVLGLKYSHLGPWWVLLPG